MAPNTSMPIGWADSFGRKLRIGAAARRSYGLARGSGHLSKRERNAAEDLRAGSGHAAFRKIEGPYERLETARPFREASMAERPVVWKGTGAPTGAGSSGADFELSLAHDMSGLGSARSVR